MYADAEVRAAYIFDRLTPESKRYWFDLALAALRAAAEVRTDEGNSALHEWTREWVGDAFAEPGTAQAFSEEQISVGRKDSRDD